MLTNKPTVDVSSLAVGQAFILPRAEGQSRRGMKVWRPGLEQGGALATVTWSDGSDGEINPTEQVIPDPFATWATVLPS